MSREINHKQWSSTEGLLAAFQKHIFYQWLLFYSLRKILWDLWREPHNQVSMILCDHFRVFVQGDLTLVGDSAQIRVCVTLSSRDSRSTHVVLSSDPSRYCRTVSYCAGPRATCQSNCSSDAMAKLRAITPNSPCCRAWRFPAFYRYLALESRILKYDLALKEKVKD